MCGEASPHQWRWRPQGMPPESPEPRRTPAPLTTPTPRPTCPTCAPASTGPDAHLSQVPALVMDLSRHGGVGVQRQATLMGWVPVARAAWLLPTAGPGPESTSC